MSYDQYVSQVRSSDLAQLDESDMSPMILRSLGAGRPFLRLPFLCPPHPVVQLHTKERMFLHGMLDTRGVTQRHAWIYLVIGRSSCTLALKGGSKRAQLIATWFREGPAMS